MNRAGVLTILVVDDEPQIRRLLVNALTGDAAALGVVESSPRERGAQLPEVRVLEASTGAEGIDLAAAESPSLIVLDLGLPDRSGLEVCREIRRWSSAPIVVLSARHADTEKAALLDAGADDYMTKPFSTVEFMARVRAQLRRARTAGAGAPAETVITCGDLSIDLPRRRVERAGTMIHLTPTEWGLLRALVTHPRQTLTHTQLFQQVWGNVEGDAQQYLRVYVGHLRRKIETDPVRPQFIQTEAGVGYRFEPDDGAAA